MLPGAKIQRVIARMLRLHISNGLVMARGFPKAFLAISLDADRGQCEHRWRRSTNVWRSRLAVNVSVSSADFGTIRPD